MQQPVNPADIHKAKQLYEFFERIPDNQWTCGDLQDFTGRKCALGHMGVIHNTDHTKGLIGYIPTPDAQWLGEQIDAVYGWNNPRKIDAVWTVNDQQSIPYPTPKARILNTIKHIIARLTGPTS